MTEADVCPDAAELGRNGLSGANSSQKARSTGRECRPWFPNGARSASIGAKFESHLGDVGLTFFNNFQQPVHARREPYSHRLSTILPLRDPLGSLDAIGTGALVRHCAIAVERRSHRVNAAQSDRR
jgi:hypothetical protein